jgi:pimeloyl-ACP methyl ester carboxylesterase
MRRNIIVLQLFLLLLTGCYKGEVRYVDFTDLNTAETTTFRVTAQKTTNLQDLSNDPEWLDLVGVVGDTATSPQANVSGINSPQRATSTSVASVMQELFDFSKTAVAVEVSGVYKSVDINNDPILLSGKVILPAKGPIKRYILVSHYTIASNREAPSNIFSLEGLLVKLGYALIIPDYIGYGVTADKVHPYLVMELTARNVLDMYDAVVPFLEKAGCAPEHDDIYLMGYSQGGATTMAVLHEIEHNEIPIKIRRVFAGGGPYDIKYTYDQFVETNWASYPCAVPIMMQGMVVGNKLDLDMSTMMASNIYENLDEWVNSKLYTSNQINALIGTNVTSNLLTPIGMDRTSKEVSELYKAMTENSILTYSWTPKAPVFIFHSMDDDVVPFENAMRAKSKWKNANIQYSFGHYGTHQLGCVRFIYTVQTLLQNDEKEENGNFSF